MQPREAWARWSMVTLTMPHHAGDELRELLDRLLAAWRRVRATRTVREILARRVGASVRALEITIGDNGWHPHIHLLWQTDTLPVVDGDAHPDLAEPDGWTARERDALVDAWCAATGASRARGVWFSEPFDARDAGAESMERQRVYAAKLGCELSGAGKVGSRKGARRDGAPRTEPVWSLLEHACDPNSTRGERARARALWAEYDAAIHGRRLFELDERAASLADAGAADADAGEDAIVRRWTVAIAPEQWAQLGRADWAGLDSAATLEPVTVARAAPWGTDPSPAVARAVARWCSPEGDAAIAAAVASRLRPAYDRRHDRAHDQAAP